MAEKEAEQNRKIGDLPKLVRAALNRDNVEYLAAQNGVIKSWEKLKIVHQEITKANS